MILNKSNDVTCLRDGLDWKFLDLCDQAFTMVSAILKGNRPHFAPLIELERHIKVHENGKRLWTSV